MLTTTQAAARATKTTSRLLKCQRCEYEWMPRRNTDKLPNHCAKCNSPYWDRPRKLAKGVGQ